MDKQRREFLKIVGISTVAGLGGVVATERLVSGSTPQSEVPASGHEAAAHGEVKVGKRYGLVVDLREFRKNPALGDKVVEACHKSHNVPKFSKKDEIKWVWMTEYESAFPDNSHEYKDEGTRLHQVPVMCNHCDQPPCVRACPTRATFKTENGIVAMDYHRCFGCRFCMAACPYGMRSFNWRDPKDGLNPKEVNREFPARMRGVVEKCTLCSERVEIGKQPVCVEACGSSKAIVFGDLNDPESEIRKLLRENYTLQRKPSLGTHPSVFYIV